MNLEDFIALVVVLFIFISLAVFGYGFCHLMTEWNLELIQNLYSF